MMKRLTILLFLLATGLGMAQDNPVRIVFDVTTDDEDTHRSAIRHVKYMAKAYPDSEFEVVMYSKAMNMVLPDKSVVAEDVANLAQQGNVKFVICEGTMKRHKVKKEDLITGVETVPDGILEIITKQAEGWGYIKEAHN